MTSQVQHPAVEADRIAAALNGRARELLACAIEHYACASNDPDRAARVRRGGDDPPLYFPEVIAAIEAALRDTRLAHSAPDVTAMRVAAQPFVDIANQADDFAGPDAYRGYTLMDLDYGGNITVDHCRALRAALASSPRADGVGEVLARLKAIDFTLSDGRQAPDDMPLPDDNRLRAGDIRKIIAALTPPVAGVARERELLRQALEAINTGRSEPLFIMRDAIRNWLEDNPAPTAAGDVGQIAENANCSCAEVEGEDPDCPLHWHMVDDITLRSAVEILEGQQAYGEAEVVQHLRNIVTRALQGRDGGGAWLPIESAPKGDDPKEENGPAILIWREEWPTGYEGFWYAHDQAWYFANLDSEYGGPEYPTHWQPLPAALSPSPEVKDGR